MPLKMWYEILFNGKKRHKADARSNLAEYEVIRNGQAIRITSQKIQVGDIVRWDLIKGSSHG